MADVHAQRFPIDKTPSLQLALSFLLDLSFSNEKWFGHVYPSIV
jgi:hypothetical protein